MIQNLLQYEFLQNAYISGILIGLIAPLLGVFIVSKRLALIPDALSHVSLSGVAIATFLISLGILPSDFNPMLLGIVFSVIGAIILWQLTRQFHNVQEIGIAILMSLSLGLSVIFIALSKGVKLDLTSYLFGSINTISRQDLVIIAVLTVATLIFVRFQYRKLFAIVFDEDFIRVRNLRINLVNGTFFVFIGLIVAVSMKIVGVLLISALMTLPVAIAIRLAKSFKQTIVYAVISGEIGVIVGLVSSYYLNLPSGGTIVVTLVLLLLIVFSWTKILKNKQKRLTTK
ncbi:MAG: metal ABC transporter permease [Culicoidibacterales bacterium]